ncbi:MAG: hypothetical protein ISS17_01030 [Bacteroidales bacterium]|nr:hypothetical protein [Bacteroidales bacterium]
MFIKWRQANENANTLLVTVTPINNQLSDLTNQIMLGSGGEIHKLGRFYDRGRQKFYTMQERLQTLQDEIKRQLRENRMVNYQQIKEQFTPLLNRFIIRRSRQGIENEYPEGFEINGKLQKFPQSYPYNLEYELPNQYKTQLLIFASEFDLLLQAYSYTDDSLSDLEYLAHPLDLFEHFKQREKPVQTSLEVLYSGLLTFGFPCYRYHIYRHAYYKRKRGELKLNVDENRELSRQIGIYGIFRTIFLKRLESSLYSIQVSILNYEKKLKDFKEKLEKYNKIISVKNLEKLNKAIDAYNEQRAEEDELDIEKDLRIISVLKEQLALLIKKDNKIKVLADKLDENEESKVLVFTYKNSVKNLPKGKWGFVQMRNEDDDFVHLAHMVDEKNEAGYFVAFDKNRTGELITATEGLLHIKATSDQNQQFKDTFKNKPQTESYINNFIKTYQFTEEDHKNRFNKSQEEAIILLRNKMIEYGYPVDIIENVYNCIMYSQNAYFNKQNMKLVRLVARLARNNKHIGDEVIQNFIDLAIQYRPEEKSEKAPLSEIIQIFTQ